MPLSLKDRRVVIASLFLPQGTVYYDDDSRSTVTEDELPQTVNKTVPLNAAKAQQMSIGFSLVDELMRAATPITSTPPVEDKVNPFSAVSSPRLGPQQGIRPLPSRLPTLNIIPSIVVPAKSQGPRSAPVAAESRPTRRPSHRTSRATSRSSSVRRSDSVVRSTPRLGFLEAPHYTPWQIEPSSHGNVGLFNAVNSVGDAIQKKLWVGLVDCPTDDFPEGLRVDLEMKYQSQHESLPVWIKDAEFTEFYDVYCHQVLWPTLHYAVPDAPRTRLNLYDSKSFERYRAVNLKFAEAIVSNHQDGDIIMVNDYHLMLVPQMIRERIPKATIGFFLHVTFPSSEIFRCLAARQKLLRGMLGADLIAFQTSNHMRHFRQTVHRILSLEALPKGIQLENTFFVDVTTLPMGIDLATLDQKRRDPEVEEWVTNLQQRYAGVKLIVGRDKLDEVQGVRQKVLAFETFLDRHPEFRGKVVLVQIALSTTSENENMASDALSTAISRINARFSSLSYTPVVLLHTSELNFNQYLALLTVADAFIVTSLREGMALRTHEFIQCQEQRKRPLILSEFTGSYSFTGFRSCFVVNPYDARQTADAIAAALAISDDEAASRWNDLHNHIISQTAQAFVTSFLNRTLRAHAEHTQRPFDTIPTLPPLTDESDIIQELRNSKKRLILLGVENTLFQHDPKTTRDLSFSVPQDVLNLLQKLSEDERNVIYLLSSRPVAGALEKVSDALPYVGIVAEDGCYIKAKANKGEKTEFVSLVGDVSMQWKESCIEILNYFTERTPGSFIEERGASIRWRYWPGNPDDSELPWARRQAAEAQNHIWDSLGEKFGLRIVPATRSFLVLPQNASRQSAVELILRPEGPPKSESAELPSAPSPHPHTPGETPFDYVLAIGSEERLLNRLNVVPHSVTVSTSHKNSNAKWRLERQDVLAQLENLVKACET
ncbi:glycosyltransferase family 20 protein [Tulasnella calospora MUT 4182]|uniref:Glycosyltransferase family 20 protein n=1 Tax=Tulasnella calospora MUT 4182 TaxID=1051891 RepID=A0A0C3QFR9_9AGAM|nr:glycosyltransferase family 20 protein [Tulasnella calospora MUT 4182]